MADQVPNSKSYHVIFVWCQPLDTNFPEHHAHVCIFIPTVFTYHSLTLLATTITSTGDDVENELACLLTTLS